MVTMNDVIKKELILDSLDGYEIHVPLMPLISAASWLNSNTDDGPAIARQLAVAVYIYVGQLERNRYYYEFAGVVIR